MQGFACSLTPEKRSFLEKVTYFDHFYRICNFFFLSLLIKQLIQQKQLTINR